MAASKVWKDIAEHYVWGEQCDGWHLVKGSGLSVIQERMPPGTFEAKHFHQQSRQFFYVLSGQAVMELEGNCVTLNPQEGIEIPPGTVHQIFNQSEQDVEFLVISQPTSIGDRVSV